MKRTVQYVLPDVKGWLYDMSAACSVTGVASEGMRPWYEKAKALLKAKNGRYVDLAAELDVGESAIGHYLNGRREPSLDQVRKIAAYLGTSLSDLCEEDAYFLVQKHERELIDYFRNIPEDRRAIALEILASMSKRPA